MNPLCCELGLFQMQFAATDLKKIKSTFEVATPLSFIITKKSQNHKFQVNCENLNG